MLREAREEAFQAFVAELHGRLVSLRERADYPAILRTLIRESIAPVPAATVLRVDPRDERLVAELRRELAAELEVEPTLETAGGVELADRDGRTARNTIEERLANAEPELRLLFGAMFGGRPPAGPEPEPEQAKLR